MLTKNNVVLFSITNSCNAKCKSCSFWKTKKPAFPKKEELDRTLLNIRNKLKCGFLQITGGEPLTYPYLFELLYKAHKLGMVTQLMTNGSLLNKHKINKLNNAKLNLIAFSIDHYDHKIFEENRGIPDLSEKIRENVRHLKKTNIIIHGGITITTHNIAKLEETAKYALDIGCHEIYFCLPVKNTNSTYKLGNKDFTVTDIPNLDMAEVIERLLKLKRRLGHKMVHPVGFLKDIRNYYLKREQHLPCKGGEKIFYLDNNLILYQCMTKSKRLGNINGKIKLLNDIECYDCPLQCFREWSIYLYSLKSFPFFIEKMFNRMYWKLLKKY